jgi:hypothetical protein
MSQAKAVKTILQQAIRQSLTGPAPIESGPAPAPTSNEDRLEAARQAPRCMHVRSSGVRCGSPAMRGDAFCYFHDRLYNRPAEESFPFLEDAASIQMAIMQVLDGLRRGKLEKGVANSLLFGLQTASSNLKRADANLQPVPSRVITQDPVDEARAARRGKPPRSDQEGDGNLRASVSPR